MQSTPKQTQIHPASISAYQAKCDTQSRSEIQHVCYVIPINLTNAALSILTDTDIILFSALHFFKKAFASEMFPNFQHFA